MDELEQIRKEVNELRERIVMLENRPAPVPLDLMRFGTPPAGTPPVWPPRGSI